MEFTMMCQVHDVLRKLKALLVAGDSFAAEKVTSKLGKNMSQFYARKLFQKSSSAASLRINLAQPIHETRAKNEVPIINVVSSITFQVKLHQTCSSLFFWNGDQYFYVWRPLIVSGCQKVTLKKIELGALPDFLSQRQCQWTNRAQFKSHPVVHNKEIFLLGKLLLKLIVQQSHPLTKSLAQKGKKWPHTSKMCDLLAQWTSWNFFKPWLTSIFKLLCPTVLTFALVRASGSSQAKQSRCTKSWSGILIPTRRVVGFNPGFNSSVLSNTRVTGPGSKSWRAWRLMVTFPHLKDQWETKPYSM